MNQSGEVVQADWLNEVTTLEDEHRRAFLARDIDRLNELWSDGLLVNSPINRVNDKRQVLGLLQAGTIAHSSFEAEIEVIERRQDLVVVMGSERIVNAPGTPVVHRRFTNVWRPEGGVRRMVLRHANIVPGT
jgi:hypothetical protein